MSKINKKSNRKLGSKILLSSLSVPAIVSSVQQSNVNAGWFSGILSSAGDAYNSVKKSVSKNYNQAKKSAGEAYKRVKESLKYFLYTDQDVINKDKKQGEKNLSALGEFVADTIKGSYGIYKHAKNIFTGNEDENLGLTNKESWASFVKNLANLNLSNILFFKDGNKTINYKDEATIVTIKGKDKESVIEIKYNEENKTLKCTLTRDQKTSQINDAKTLMKEISNILKETNPLTKVYTEAYNNSPESLRDIKFSKYDKATEEEWKSFVEKLEKSKKIFTDSLHDANGTFSSVDENTVWFKLINGKNSNIGLTYLSDGKVMIARADLDEYVPGKSVPTMWSVSEDFNDLKDRLSFAFSGKNIDIKIKEGKTAATSLNNIFSDTEID